MSVGYRGPIRDGNNNGLIYDGTEHEQPAPVRSDVTDSKEFRDWFGKSKMVNADGTPKRFYHGTYEDFTEFDDSRLGEQSEGIGTAAFGHWFFATEKGAKWFMDDNPNAEMMTAYLKIENPYVMEEEEFLQYEEQELEYSDGVALRKRLIKEGYDGVIVPAMDWVTAFHGKNVWVESEGDEEDEAEDYSAAEMPDDMTGEVEVYDTNTGQLFTTVDATEARAMFAEELKENGTLDGLGVRKATEESKLEREQKEREFWEERDRMQAESLRQDELSTPQGLRPGHKDYVEPPERLYHATYSASKILEEGFKSSADLGSQVLGGSAGHLISFTTRENAEVYRNGLDVARKAAQGELDDDDAVDAATQFNVAEDRARELLSETKREGNNYHEFFQRVSMEGKKFPLFMGGSWPENLKTAEPASIVSVASQGIEDIRYNPGESEWRVGDYGGIVASKVDSDHKDILKSIIRKAIIPNPNAVDRNNNNLIYDGTKWEMPAPAKRRLVPPRTGEGGVILKADIEVAAKSGDVGAMKRMFDSVGVSSENQQRLAASLRASGASREAVREAWNAGATPEYALPNEDGSVRIDPSIAIGEKEKSTIDSLKKAYPWVKLNRIRSTDSYSEGVLASKDNWGISFNSKHDINSQEFWDKHTKEWGDLAMSDNEGRQSLEVVLVHEFGHKVLGELASRNSELHRKWEAYKNEVVQPDGATSKAERWQWSAYLDHRSFYGAESTYEFEAEAFTDLWYRGENASEAGRVLASILEEANRQL